jgi:hypothetical protein
VAEQGYLAPLDHSWCRQFLSSLNALASMFPPQLSSHTHRGSPPPPTCCAPRSPPAVPHAPRGRPPPLQPPAIQCNRDLSRVSIGSSQSNRGFNRVLDIQWEGAHLRLHPRPAFAVAARRRRYYTRRCGEELLAPPPLQPQLQPVHLAAVLLRRRRRRRLQCPQLLVARGQCRLQCRHDVAQLRFALRRRRRSRLQYNAIGISVG